MTRRFQKTPPNIPQVRAAYNTTHGRSLLRDSDRFYRWAATKVIRDLPTRGASVLDVGCGGGFLLAALEQLEHARGARPGRKDLGSLDLHGLELSDVALEKARKEAPTARLILGQGEQLPYPDDRFHSVLCLGNLEHFLDPEAGARELARVTRPDGTVWILLPNGFYSGAIWNVIRTGYGPNHHQIIDRFGTINEWRDFLENNDLEVVETLPYNRFKWWKRLLPRNLAWHFLYRTRPKKETGPRE